MEFIHPLLIALYIVLPLAATAVAIFIARRRRSRRPVVNLLGTSISASLLGIGLNVAYAYYTQNRIQLLQVLLTAYLAMAVLLLLKGVSALLKLGLDRLLHVHAAKSPEATQTWGWAVRVAAGIMLRVILLFGLGLPYIMAVGMVYRPKVSAGSSDDPKHLLGADFQEVQFDSMDGIHLSAWWIPAGAEPPMRKNAPPPKDWGRKTVILCHGLGASKGNHLPLVRDLVPDGYNVVAFDFRAHGSSGGQLVSFGDRERYDVLGAVRWVRQNHPEESRRLYGLGASMGAAALIAAAADDSPEGRAFDAIAVYATFDRFDSLADDVSRNLSVPNLGWLARNIGVPIMSFHAGANLNRFAPAEMIDRIAPRPLLIIHGRGDFLIPFDAGVRLFDSASQPKLRLWIGKWDKKANDGNGAFLNRLKQPADHEGILFDDDAARAVHLLFEEMPKVM